MALRRDGAAWKSSELLDTDITIASFGEDESGNLYVVGNELDENDQPVGVVYRLVDPTWVWPHHLFVPSFLSSVP